MSYIPPFNPYALPTQPFLGGSLATGPTGLGGLVGQLPGIGQLPYSGDVMGGLMRGGPTGIPSSLAGQAGRVAMTDLPFTGPGMGSRLATQAAGSWNPSNLAVMGKGGLVRTVAGRAGLGAVAGGIGSQLIDATNIGGQNSNLEQGLQGASYGAGIGAAVGAPLFGLGAVPGAAIGGAIGGGLGVLANIFGGDDEEEVNPVKILGTAMSKANLTPEMAHQILTTYDTQMSLAEGLEDKDREAQEALAYNTASQMILAAMQQQAQAPVDASNMLALQQQASQLFEPLAANIEQSGQMYADAMAANRGNLPESYRGIADSMVAGEQASTSKLADAYRAQAAIMPMVDRMTQYQQDNASYAAQLFQQALQQQGGGAATSDVLTALQP